MRLLVDAFGEGARRGDLSFDFFSELMTRVRRNSAMDQDAPLTFESFAAAGSGESKLYGKLKEWSELA